MAYMSQERKASIAPEVKKILAKYNLKGTLGVRHHSTLVLNIKSGPVDFVGEHLGTSDNGPRTYFQVNVYHVASHFSGTAKNALGELVTAMNVGNHDNSDIQSDYHDVGWYVDINVGRYDAPYELKQKGAN